MSVTVLDTRHKGKLPTFFSSSCSLSNWSWVAPWTCTCNTVWWMGCTYYPCTRDLESIEKAVLSQLGITGGKERAPADKEGDGSRQSSEEAWHGWQGQDGHLWWRIFTDQSGKVVGSEILASFNSKEFRLYPINVQLFEVFEEENGKIKFIFQNRTPVVRKKGGTEISETTNNKEDIGVV